MRAALAILLFLLPGTVSAARAAPFGLDMGARPPELRIHRDNGDGTVVLDAVPQSFPGIDRFFARYDPENGLCSLGGATAPFQGDGAGLDARDYFWRLAERLAGIYGASHHYDVRLDAKPAPDGKSPGWTGEVARRERLFYSFRNSGSGARMKDNVASIALSIGADRHGAAFVLVQFDFANVNDCAERQARREALAL